MDSKGRKGIVALALAGLMFVLAGCWGSDDSELRTIQPGDVVYIVGTNPDGDNGDKALIEQKPNRKAWVIPVYANFRDKPTGDFNVKVTLTETGFTILDIPAGIKVGKDHDNCLNPAEETYVALDQKVKDYVADPKNWEQDTKKPDNSNDDCIPLSQQTEQ